MAALTHQEKEERTKKIEGMIKRGMSLAEISRELNVRPESVRRFLKVRNMKTKSQEEWERKQSANSK